MQQTFDNAGPTAKGSLNEVQQQDQQRQAANQSGQQNVPGEASRAQVASKDPKGELRACRGAGSRDCCCAIVT